MPTGRPITEQIKNQVVNTYLREPMTISRCAEIMGLSSPTVIKILDEYNIPRYAKAKIFNPSLNEHYFQNIDTEYKAYFLGFIVTDGNVFTEESSSNRQSSISITQSESDKYILEKFLQETNSNTSIGYDGRGTCMAAIRSNIMATDLAKYGVVENKTLFAKLPIINEKFMHHLIRGILDGDGSITSLITKQNKHKHAISFCGTERLMNELGNYLRTHVHISRPKVYTYTGRHLSEIKWQSINDCYKLGEWMYTNANIYLQRKKDKYESFKSHYNL